MQKAPHHVKRGLTAAITAAVLILPAYTGDLPTAQADVRPSAHLAQREMKKDRNYQPSSLYARAHEMIYGRDGAVELNARPRIAVLINGDEDLLVEDRVKNQIYGLLRKKFPREYFALIKGTDMNTRLMQYAEDVYYDTREDATSTLNERNPEHSEGLGGPLGPVADILVGGASIKEKKVGGVTKSSKVDVDGMPVGIRPRGLADMRCEDYVRVGREFGYDYAFVITLNKGQSTSYHHNYFLFTQKTNTDNVWLRMRFVDMTNGNYLYRNDIAAKAKRHNGWTETRSLASSVGKALTEALNDIEVDTGVGRR